MPKSSWNVTAKHKITSAKAAEIYAIVGAARLRGIDVDKKMRKIISLFFFSYLLCCAKKGIQSFNALCESERYADL